MAYIFLHVLGFTGTTQRFLTVLPKHFPVLSPTLYHGTTKDPTFSVKNSYFLIFEIDLTTKEKKKKNLGSFYTICTKSHFFDC